MGFSKHLLGFIEAQSFEEEKTATLTVAKLLSIPLPSSPFSNQLEIVVTPDIQHIGETTSLLWIYMKN